MYIQAFLQKEKKLRSHRKQSICLFGTHTAAVYTSQEKEKLFFKSVSTYAFHITKHNLDCIP